MTSQLVARIADQIQDRGRKATTGEYLVFDRHTLERAIEEGFKRYVATYKQEQP